MIGGGPGGEDTPDDENTHRRSRSAPGGSRHNREDEELQKALEASKQTAELEAKKTALSAEYVDPSFPGPTCHLFSNAFTGSVIFNAPSRCLRRKKQNAPRRLRKRIPNPYSKTALHKTAMHKQRTSYPNLRVFGQSSYTLTNSIAVNTNPFPLVDASALQPQYTLQPQFTIQPQITSFNPYLAQQQQEAQQLAWAQQQQEWQQQEWLRQQAELQAAQAQAQLQAQNDWAMQQMQLQQLQQMQTQQHALQQQQQQQQQQTTWLQAQPTSPLIAQTTGFGSKNPFALSSASAVPPVPQLPTHAPSHSPGPAPSRSAPPTTSVPTVKVSDNPDNATLAALFANREGGTDTFGNIGNLRCALDFALCLTTLTEPQIRTHTSRAGSGRDSDRSCPTACAQRPAVLFRVVMDLYGYIYYFSIWTLCLLGNRFWIELRF